MSPYKFRGCRYHQLKQCACKICNILIESIYMSMFGEGEKEAFTSTLTLQQVTET